MDTKITRRVAAHLFGATWAAGALSPIFRGAARAATDALLPINIANTSGSLSLVFEKLLQMKGFMDQFGVRPNIVNVSDGSKVVGALVSGHSELCAGSGFSDVLSAIERGADIKIVAGATISPVNCIYARDPRIRTSKDLVGRTVGTGAPGALLHQLVVAWLLKEGVDYKKVKFVNVGSAPNVLKAVASGIVDAGPSEVDFYDQQAKYGIHALSDGLLWNELPDFTNQAMFASGAAIRTKRDVLVRAVAAYGKMFRFLAGPDSEADWIKARADALNSTDEKEAKTQWLFYHQPNRFATNLVLTPNRIEYIQKLNVLLGNQTRIMPFREIADMSVAQDALGLLSRT